MRKYKTIGIIGGQGPVSTADFYMRIVKSFQDNFGVRYIRDYPPMIIFSVPTPDLVKSVADEELTFSRIAEAIKKLEQDGADFIIIACISLQYLIGRLQALIKIPIIGIVPIVAAYAKNKGYKTVGILATDTTLKKRTFDSYLNEAGIKLIAPLEENQNSVEEIILNIIGGNITTKDTEMLKKVIGNLQKDGADAIILACTELPVVLKQQDLNIPLIDVNELYIQKTVKLSSKI